MRRLLSEKKRLLRKFWRLRSKIKWQFFGGCTLFIISDFVEDRLHLGNPKKNAFFFGISLDLHYLCTQNSKT